MSAVKEKKINKIKNKKIWPRIVAAVFGVIFMVSLTIGAITTTICSIFLSRFTDLSNTAEGISEYFTENINNGEACIENLKGIMKCTGNLENISVLYRDDKTGENKEYVLTGDSYSVALEVGLDDFMISEVAKQQAKWMSEGKELFPISVNVSRAHFTRADLAEHICGIVDKYGVPHDKIELELTESAFFDDKEVLIKTVKKLKEYGFEISMDDFGAGYSSLNSLKEMPLDVLKLDADIRIRRKSIWR